MKRFIDVGFNCPCNLKCPYCLADNIHAAVNFRYEPSHIVNGLSLERLGGSCLFQITGAGETLLSTEVVPVVHGLLRQGHYVNITTNGTVSKRIEELMSCETVLLEHLCFTFSLHYTELMRLNLLNDFIENVKVVKKKGCSFCIVLCLADEYFPYMDEIKHLCQNEFGALPQVDIVRYPLDLQGRQGNVDMVAGEYNAIAKSFDSPFYCFIRKIYKQKRREFCYAGDWSFVLGIDTGLMRKCVESGVSHNIFSDISMPIPFAPMGYECPSAYCNCGVNFLTLGVIPRMKTPNFVEVRDREHAGWYTPPMKQVLSSKLKDNNSEYGLLKKLDYYISANITTLRSSKLFKQPQTNITVEALDKRSERGQFTEVKITKIVIDNVAYAPCSLLRDGWYCDGSSIRWNNYTPNIEKTAVLEIPSGRKRELYFSKNKWMGMAIVNLKNKDFLYDGYADADNDIFVLHL